MGRTPTPCCSYVRLNKGPWTPDEDLRLINYIQTHGQGNWRSVPKKAGLQRCGKGCRLRWMNYLRPNVKRGHILPDEEDMIIRLHKLLGNRWSLIAGRIPGRTDNEVKNYWNTHFRKKDSVTKGHSRNMGCDKSCELEQTRALCIIEKGSIVKENTARSHIGEIVSILRGAEEFIYNSTAYDTQNAESIENLKQLIDGFHYPGITMDSISNIHSAWPDGNHHPSSYMPSIYSPEFEPRTSCPSYSIIRGLYHSMSDGSASMQGQEPWVQLHSLVSRNYMNSTDKTISDVIHNMKLETAAEPQFHNHPFVFSTEDVLPTEYCNVFVPCSNLVLPDPKLGQNMILNTFLQPEDPTTSQCSEPWFSSSDWFDRIEQLYS